MKSSENIQTSKWISKVKNRPFSLVIVFITTLLVAISTLVTNLDNLRNLLSTEEIAYTAIVEITPVHILYGALENSKYIASDPDTPKEFNEISMWVAQQLSDQAKSRGFGIREPEEYILEINGSSLSLSNRSKGKNGFLYAISPRENSLMFFDSIDGGKYVVFRGIKNLKDPQFFQIYRTLHKISTEPFKTIELGNYFSPDKEQENPYTNAGGFVQNDCSCLIFTFHGSNGQFKGDLVTVYKNAEGNERSYSFSNKKNEKVIISNPREARALVTVTSESPEVRNFDITLRRDLQDIPNISPTVNIRSKEDLKENVEKIRRMPISYSREELIEQLAVDYIVEVVLSENKIKKLFGFVSI